KRGNFPNYKGSVFDRAHDGQMRNATVTTIAPTGTLSIIVNTSSGIEPIFAVVYTRQHILDDDQFLEVHPLFETVAKKEDFYSEDLMKRIASSSSIQDIEVIPEEVRKVFQSAHDVSPEWHVRIQAAFQEHTDNAVSKTVNFPNEATKEDVQRVYWLAYKSGLKGITIYRDGSRDKQVLSVEKKEKPLTPADKISPRSRPSVTTGVTERIGTGCGHLYVTMNEDADGLCEVFARMGKSGGCAATQSEAISRLISLALRSGIEIEAILKQLRGIRCPFPIWQTGTMVLSCPDAIGLVVKRYLEGTNNEPGEVPPPNSEAALNPPENNDLGNPERKSMITCPECDSPVEYESGCVVCRACGYSKCQ
ncbi:TSCPD domain-containing protein, partial [candidate division KSB1 bacterium]